MHAELHDTDILFFSPTENALPRHVRICFRPVAFVKQVGVSIWLHLNVLRIITRYRLDKLNLHTGPGGVILTRRLPVPLLVTCHHTYWQQFHHIRSQFWKCLFLPFEKKTYQLATGIVCVSEATRRALVEHYGIPESKITVIPNAIDRRTFHRLDIPRHVRSLAYVGRIDKRKGIEFLIRSMPLVRERMPDVLLRVAGTGDYLGKMETLVRRLGLENNVKFLGFVPDEQLNELYNQAQCVVAPSMFEGFGITVIEALAAGTRVVGTDVDGIREILARGEYGRLVPYGNHQALADAIVAELNEPREAAPLRGEYQVEHFRERYRHVLEHDGS